jgi:hypothetical protein
VLAAVSCTSRVPRMPRRVLAHAIVACCTSLTLGCITAIEQANNTALKSKVITVSAFKSRKEVCFGDHAFYPPLSTILSPQRLEEYAKAEHTFVNVYVKNLADEVTDAELFNLVWLFPCLFTLQSFLTHVM